jgi:hypothetical protein
MVDDSYRGYRNDPYGRGGAGSSEPATDPLTELARLIGQSDPFGDRNRRADGHGSADWRNDAQQPSYPDQNAGYTDHYGTAPDQAQYDQHAGQGDYQAGYDDAQQYAANGADPYAANGAGQYAANGADQAYPNHSEHDGGGYADPHGHDDASYQQGTQPQYAEPDGGAHDPSQQNGPPNLGPPPYFAADPQAGRPDAYYDDAPAPRRRGWLITVAALVGLAVLGTAGAFAYRAVVAGGPPPLITRDVRPDKMVPPTQNADNGSNRQPDRLASGGNEQMAPPPEQPINVAVTPQPPAAQNAIPAASPALSATPGLPTPVATPTAPTGPNSPAAPRKIHTVKISADQEPAGAALVPPRPSAPRAVPPRGGAPAPRDANAPLSLAPQGVPDQPAAPARNVAPGGPMRTAALAPAAPPAEAAGGAGYYVQVSAQKTQEEARASFRGIQAKYANILQGHAPVFRRKDLGNKGVFFGAQVGPFSREGAAHLCEQLKSAGGSCMIQRN